jgi:hypothetical protein
MVQGFTISGLQIEAEPQRRQRVFEAQVKTNMEM